MISAKRVTDRTAIANGVRGGELHIVIDEIQVSFRPDEEPPVRIHLQARPKLSEKVRTGEVVRAGSKAALKRIRVEADTLGANAGGELSLHVLGNVRPPNSIEIPEQRPVGLETGIQGLTRSPCDLPADPQVLKENYVAAECGICSARERLNRKQAIELILCCGRTDGAYSEGKVYLLGARHSHCQKQKAKTCKQTYFSQGGSPKACFDFWRYGRYSKASQ